MKKKLGIVLCICLAILPGCGKAKTKDNANSTDNTGEIITTENPAVVESQKEQDISAAKAIKTAVDTALGKEDVYVEFITNHAGKLIVVTDQGMGVLETATKDEIIKNLGEIPEVNYKANSADHFAFSVDEKGMVTVYVCNANNSTKWMLAPDIDMAYGGTVNTELIGNDQTGAIADSDVELETVMKQDDVATAKSIKTAIDSALGTEEIFIELTTNYVDTMIDFNEQGLGKLQDTIKEEILISIGKYPEVRYKVNGADHFAFSVASDGSVTVYVCNEDNSKEWVLCPELDAEYGGTATQTDVQ